MAHFWHDLGKAFCLRTVMMLLGDKLRAASFAEVAFCSTIFANGAILLSFTDIKVGGMSIMNFLDNPNINWEAISALSNFAVAFVTLITVSITLYLSWNNVRTKSKIVFKREEKNQYNDFYRIRLINKGFIPITILHKGILVHNFRWKKRDKQIVSYKKLDDGIKLDIGERENINIGAKEINNRLRAHGFETGDKVKLVAYFIDISNKIFFKKFTFVVFDQEQYNQRLNTERT